MNTTWPRCLNATSTPSLVRGLDVSQRSHGGSGRLFSPREYSVDVLLLCWPSQASAATRNVHSCTSIPSPRSKTVPGMTEASANTVSSALNVDFPAVMILTAKHTLFSLLWIFFCRPVSGPDCRHRHTRRVICVNYLVGFCPEGKSCKFMQYVILFMWFRHSRSCFVVSLVTSALGFVIRDSSHSALFPWHELCNLVKYPLAENWGSSTVKITWMWCRINGEMFLYSPRFELPMGASEQPPLPQQTLNQTKVTPKYTQLLTYKIGHREHVDPSHSFR